MKSLIGLLLIIAMLASCDNSNQNELSELRKENEQLKQMIGIDSLHGENLKELRALEEELSASYIVSPGRGNLIDQKDFDSSKGRFATWKGEARNLNPRVKKGIYPRYYFIGLDKMNYMVENSYLFNKGKDSTEMIKGFAMTMGLKDKTKGQYLFDIMIVPQIDSTRFLLIDPPTESAPTKAQGAFGDGSIMDDTIPCPDLCDGAS
jgi:hypothetical protein